MTATSLALDVAALAAADRMSALSRETDWSGLWFDLIEKESGDYVGMRAAHVPATGKKAVWHFLTHSSRDGIGALVELMRRGNPGADIPMPRLKDTSQPARLAQVGALLRLMAVWPRCARWKTHDRAWTPPAGLTENRRDSLHSPLSCALSAGGSDRTPALLRQQCSRGR